MPRRNCGFTLIEILVAIVIIGIVMSVAVLSLNIAGDDREVRQEARRLLSLLELAQDDAMMQGREFGVEFTVRGYRFVEYDAIAGQWVPVQFDESLRTWQLPEDYELSLYLENRRVPLEANPAPLAMSADGNRPAASSRFVPHLYLFSSGEATPFELHVTRLTDNLVVGVEGDLLGNLDFVTDERLARR